MQSYKCYNQIADLTGRFKQVLPLDCWSGKLNYCYSQIADPTDRFKKVLPSDRRSGESNYCYKQIINRFFCVVAKLIWKYFAVLVFKLFAFNFCIYLAYSLFKFWNGVQREH